MKVRVLKVSTILFAAFCHFIRFRVFVIAKFAADDADTLASFFFVLSRI